MLLWRCSYNGRGQIEIYKNNFKKLEMEGECWQSISSSFYPGFFLHFLIKKHYCHQRKTNKYQKKRNKYVLILTPDKNLIWINLSFDTFF